MIKIIEETSQAQPKITPEEISNKINNLPIKIRSKHKIASVPKIIFARILDIFLSSVVPIALSFTFLKWNISVGFAVSIVVWVTLLWFILYFLIIPWKWNGQTLGKFICRIRLVKKNCNLRFTDYICHELYIIFIPWGFELMSNLIFDVFFKININKILSPSDNNAVALLVFRIITTLYFVWYLGLILFIMFDEYHQLPTDQKRGIFVIYTNSVELKKIKKEPELINRYDKHIHLEQNQPGNIDESALKEIDKL